MQIEIGAPACLPLALVAFDDGAAGCLGVTLRHPAINLAARAASGFEVTGARADHVARAVRRYLRRQALPEQVVIEVELATPSHMGLSSDGLMAVAGAQAAAWVHGQDIDNVPALAAAAGLGSEDSLAVQAYAQGGVLALEAPRPGGPAPAVRWRNTLAHSDEAAWAFVLYLPRVPAGTSPTLEADRLAAWLAAAPHLDVEAAREPTARLRAALEDDDLAGFGRALLTLEGLSAAALAQSGAAAPVTPAEQAVLDIYRDHGAAAWGRSPSGLALYALIRGATPSVAVRKQVVAHVGIAGGTVMASVVDNGGARRQVQAAAPIYTGASPLISGNR